MSSSPSKIKNILRQRMIQKRLVFSAEERTNANQSIHQKVLKSWNENWKTILIYINQADEVATVPLILEFLERGKRLCVPSFDRVSKQYYPSELKEFESEIESGLMGILEPKAALCRPVEREELDVVFLPGLAFDINGNRIGYGYGYFDKICHSIRAFKIGLAYQFQIVEQIVPHTNDVAMGMIITEEKVIQCQKK